MADKIQISVSVDAGTALEIIGLIHEAEQNRINSLGALYPGPILAAKKSEAEYKEMFKDTKLNLKPEKTAEVPSAPAKKRGRPPKAKTPPPPPPIEKDEPEVDLDGGDAEEESETDPFGDEPVKPAAKAKAAPAPAQVKAAAVVYDYEKDIMPGFRAYRQRHNTAKAMELLAKFKVKTVRDLPENSYPDVMKALQQ